MIFKHYSLGEPNSQIFCSQKVALLENKFTSHLQSLAHTLVNSCIVYAKPEVRNCRAEMAQCPARAPKGVLHAFLQSLFWCCVFSQKMPLTTLGDASGFPMGCSALLASPAATYTRNHLPRQVQAPQPFSYPLPCALSWSRWRGSCCRAQMCFTSLRAWTECFPMPPLVLYQGPNPACPSGSLFSREAQGGPLAPMLVLREVLSLKALTV